MINCKPNSRNWKAVMKLLVIHATYNYRCSLQEKRLRETIHLYSDFFSLVFLHLSIVFNCHRVADKLR